MPARAARATITVAPHPGEVIPAQGENLQLSAGRPSVRLRVTNTGDRAAQVGSHFHFFEANRALDFDREQAYGMHLDIPAGTAVRFEPGAQQEVSLVPYAGSRRVYGFAGLVNGSLDQPGKRERALALAWAFGYRGVPESVAETLPIRLARPVEFEPAPGPVRQERTQ